LLGKGDLAGATRWRRRGRRRYGGRGRPWRGGRGCRGGWGSAAGQVAVHDASAVGADVDAAVDSRVAGDCLADVAVLVLVVVDTRPGGAAVVGAEDSLHATDLRDGIERRIGLTGGGLAEA